MKPLAIYIHVPFCARKCAYCDFASWPGREGQWRQYCDTLMTEIRQWSGMTDFGLLRDRFQIQTVFFGGGTPTLLPSDYIREITDRSLAIADLAPDAEITIEGNPGTLTPDKLRAYRESGVNRLSLGAQSFDDGLLRSLGRIHSASQIVEAVRMAREAGFSNINLDLMYGLPGQSMDQWLDTLDRAVALGVAHISAYSLIVEDGTPMAERVARGEAEIPPDEAVNAMQRAAVERLAKADYGRYEISNFARPGFESRHNLTYWRRGDYLGLGCAAHSMLDDCRFSNPASLDEYLAGGRMEHFERLTTEDILEETVMLATRTTRGLDLNACRARFGGVFDANNPRLAALVSAGLIEMDGDFLRLTCRGMEVQDAVVLELLDIQEAVGR